MYNRTMPTTAKEVEEIVKEAFENAETEVQEDEHHRVWGYIFWSGFKGKDSEERYRLVSERVRRRLGYQGHNVGVLIPVVRGENL